MEKLAKEEGPMKNSASSYRKTYWNCSRFTIESPHKKDIQEPNEREIYPENFAFMIPRAPSLIPHENKNNTTNNPNLNQFEVKKLPSVQS